MKAGYQIVPACPDSDFDAIRELYYRTWQSAYHDLLPASFLQYLTPSVWQPERRWQNTFSAFNAQQQLIVSVVLARPAMMNFLVGGKSIQFTLIQIISDWELDRN